MGPGARFAAAAVKISGQIWLYFAGQSDGLESLRKWM